MLVSMSEGILCSSVDITIHHATLIGLINNIKVMEGVLDM